MRDVERGTAGIGFLLGSALFTIVPTLMEIGPAIAIMVLAYKPGFTAIIAATFIAYSIHTVILTHRRLACQRAVNALEARTDSRLVDSLLNHDTVKYFAAEDVEHRRLGEVLKE